MFTTVKLTFMAWKVLHWYKNRANWSATYRSATLQFRTDINKKFEGGNCSKPGDCRHIICRYVGRYNYRPNPQAEPQILHPEHLCSKILLNLTGTFHWISHFVFLAFPPSQATTVVYDPQQKRIRLENSSQKTVNFYLLCESSWSRKDWCQLAVFREIIQPR